MKSALTVFILALTTLVGAQEVALTFDDAPTFDSPLLTYAERAERIRSQLAAHDVIAGFFVITGNINDKNSEQLKAYTREGHVLANHSHSHLSPSRVKIEHYINDITIADSILSTWQGVAPWYRYPYLNEGTSKPKRDSIRSALHTLGLTNGYVTVDNYDWYINGALLEAARTKSEINYSRLKDFYLNHIYQSLLFYDGIARQTIGRSPRHVLLLHENDLAALFLNDLILMLKANGWKIITPAVAFEDAIASHLPDVTFNGQGRIGAIGFESGIAASELVQPSEDENWLDRELVEQQIFKSKP